MDNHFVRNTYSQICDATTMAMLVDLFELVNSIRLGFKPQRIVETLFVLNRRKTTKFRHVGYGLDSLRVA